MDVTTMAVTHGHLLGGRLRYTQPRDGYRTGIEPVLLAASIPAQPGQRVLEAGTGAGAGLLCLAARVAGLSGVGVELDPAMADLARRNLQDNGLDRFEIVTADITEMALGPFDHAFANPPWHDPRSTPSPNAARHRAKQGDDLERWIAALRRTLAPAGTLTLILPAAQQHRARTALGPVSVRLLHPKAGRPAKLILVQTGPSQLPDLPPTILHQPDGSYTPELEAILRHPLSFPSLSRQPERETPSVCPESRCGESEAHLRAARRRCESTGAERPSGP